MASGAASARRVDVTNTILSILAHPDDAEFLCAGTLIRLAREHGWSVHIASMTAGDCGSVELAPDSISTVRRGEAARAAGLIGATYHCLDQRDLLIFYNEETLERVTRLVREVRPRIILTHSPCDYMLDHEVTSTLARAAAFGAPAPNFFAGRGHGPALDAVPHLYYCDPIEGKDIFGRETPPGICVDISKVIDTKAEMLACHASQREWLLKHHGIDQYLDAMKAWCARRGQAVGVAYAEGFRQHVGHAYPTDDLLGSILGVR
jgi:LmbE family N-acetylglucosaminyl deacetylase